MRIHATCVARDGAGLLLLGPSGAGKSDLALRLLDRGFELVADDQVLIDGPIARPVPQLAGLLEVRGLGLLRVRHRGETTLALALDLGTPPERLPSAGGASFAAVPLLAFEGRSASAACRAAITLDCALGRRTLAAGGFDPVPSPASRLTP